MDENRKLLRHYLGFAFQFIAILSVAFMAGIWIDRKCFDAHPVFVFILPLVTIVTVLAKVVMDTNKRK
jgi:hypothetical protein